MNSSSELREGEPERASGCLGAFEPSEAQLLQTVFSGVLGRAVFVDAAYVCRCANQEFLDFVGLTEAQLVGRSIREVLGDAALGPGLAQVDRLHRGEAIRWEGWVDYGSRGRRYLQETVTPYRRTADSAIVGFIGIARDLTDLKLREQELAEQVALQKATEAHHAAVVRAALDGVVVIDGDGLVVDFNPAAETIFGYCRDAVIGRPIADLIIPPEHRAAHQRGLKSLLMTGASRVLGKRLELPALLSTGETIPIELTITDVTLVGRRLFAAHIRDLRAAKRAEAEIRAQRNALYQKEKLAALGSLLAGVAHELNNPLSIVTGQTMMLREAMENLAVADSDDLTRRCDRIATAADRCARIVRSFLAIARQREAERTPTRLEAVVEEALELLAYTMCASGIAIARDWPEDLPMLLLDQNQIHQVVLNLLVNAQQALEQVGGEDRKIIVRIAVDRQAGSVSLSVNDNGPGVPEAIRGRIFDPFFTTKPQGAGTGIGLAVSRGLVEAHGGSLRLDDAPEGGARFTLLLPYEPALQGGEAIRETLAPAARAMPAYHVLIVDDDAAIAELLAEVAGRIGYVTTRAQNGEDAKAKIETWGGRFDAILCDIRMPSGDGPAFYDWLREQYAPLADRVGFVTGDTLGPLAGRFLADSGCPVLEKPFSPEEIRTFLAHLTNPGRDT
ncbi:PAS domain-containing hybrid sensor histidine kinase/response regulator [Chelatococcus asaccharovorans]|uniref:PAS domain-containing hybrid sensor histidine kinase/response regulator n=1 Tax=Chelatococcus asaccharovorans TaxID=28210 RepID=UPI00224C7337|nr:PAS domain S-box protein [Chelatococcus asaccharovorans]CAH1657770.1 Histidine kinase [Chelatococcus asaccharovorans]CAH1687468.1 Histidine kinase [Chelatococcus asaccharovorans]